VSGWTESQEILAISTAEPEAIQKEMAKWFPTNEQQTECSCDVFVFSPAIGVC